VQAYYSQELAWLSLGSFSAPGRVFEISDAGGLITISGADVIQFSPASGGLVTTRVNTNVYTLSMSGSGKTVASKVLVEEMVRGIEAECGVLGNHNPMVSVVGRLHVNADWYDYAAKYEPGGMDLEAPADLPEEVTAEVQRVALLAFEVCECAGMARIDFFITDEGGVVVNEINTIPGFTSTSVYAELFESIGISYPQLLERLIELALERHADDQTYAY
jgi:predicted ATP-grasp superfamily ATP-dependent carboligase